MSAGAVCSDTAAARCNRANRIRPIAPDFLTKMPIALTGKALAAIKSGVFPGLNPYTTAAPDETFAAPVTSVHLVKRKRRMPSLERSTPSGLLRGQAALPILRTCRPNRLVDVTPAVSRFLHEVGEMNKQVRFPLRSGWLFASGSAMWFKSARALEQWGLSWTRITATHEEFITGAWCAVGCAHALRNQPVVQRLRRPGAAPAIHPAWSHRLTAAHFFKRYWPQSQYNQAPEAVLSIAFRVDPG